MNPSNIDRSFAGSIPQFYERHLVPLIFEPYAKDMATRIAALHPSSVLEVAAGTGVVTRELALTLPAATSIVATDLNQPMLDHAAAIGTTRTVEWRQADAMRLPFPDKVFDVVVCQFGIMFFPDKAVAMSEARRVLRPGGTFVFNVWDRIEQNDFANAVTAALAEVFPDHPPRFLARTPHGYHDQKAIGSDLVRGGFTMQTTFDTLARLSVADSPRIPAVAYCQGTPLRNEIEARDAAHLEEATDKATAAIAGRFGAGRVEGRIQAHVVSAGR
jgi:SAM-dependent methyltransferase